ncbi:MAG: alpha/beta hydrolase [Planctomycetes bacterium]|nr:alpha/beta hydrolase [Planctomycetota bacterium]
MKPTLLLAALLFAAWCGPCSLAQEAPKPFPETNPQAEPPSQPTEGPGSTAYAHAAVETHDQGVGGEHFWVYTPAEPRPAKAPVVCFVHGYGALEPEPYLGWLKHICRRGAIVIYPQYQAHGLEPTSNYAPNSAKAVLEAFAWLEADQQRVQPDKDKFAIVGHSAGGMTTGNLAADWETLKLPKPRAAMPVQPGRAFSYTAAAQKNGLIPLSDFARIPADCLLLPVFGDSDATVGAWCARKIFADASAVKPENKNLVEFRSCLYCSQRLVAHHTTPAATVEEHDALDWYGYWKLLDGLTDAAFHGKNREYALGNTEKQRFMGKYSDGRPVCELSVTLGDAKVDPDQAYEPRYARDGSPFNNGPKRREERPRREAPPEEPRKREEKPAPAPEGEREEEF